MNRSLPRINARAPTGYDAIAKRLLQSFADVTP
jgi:hypothetical protein